MALLSATWPTVWAIPERQSATLNLPSSQSQGSFVVQRTLADVHFNQPLQVVTTPADPGHFYTVERQGYIQRLSAHDAGEATAVLDLNDKIGDITVERGLLSAAFHPRFEEEPYLFVYHTMEDNTEQGEGGYMRLARYTVDRETMMVDVDSEAVLIHQYDLHPDHQGGTLLFGLDGYLYLGVGDGGQTVGAVNNTQKIDEGFFSAILRLDIDERAENLVPNAHPASRGNYRVPADNPFVDAVVFNGEAVDPEEVRTEFWAVGFRNPFRMQINPRNGELWVGDVGLDSWEELNRVRKGKNYGWPLWEGPASTGNRFLDPPAGVAFEPPVWSYSHEVGSAITVGEFYFGTQFPELTGRLLLADYSFGKIWALDTEAERPVPELIAQGRIGITHLAVDPRDGGILISNLHSWRMEKIERDQAVNEEPPALLSEVGAFEDLGSMTTARGVMPYEINLPFWSDHATKARFFTVPLGETIGFSEEGNWSFPTGTVWIKNFELETIRGHADSRIRVETRFLVKSQDGVYGLSYKWNEEETDASLVSSEGLVEEIPITDENGVSRQQRWQYPSRSSCLACHTSHGGLALGFNTAQLNREHEGVSQIVTLSEMGYFDETPENEYALPKLYAKDDESVSLTQRVKSYLQANCVQCHQPDGSAIGEWDGRYSTSVLDAGLLHGRLLRPSGGEDDHVVTPGSPERSVLLQRISSASGRMPPLATFEYDTEAAHLIRRWIESEAPLLKTYDEWKEGAFADSNASHVRHDDPDEDGLSNYGEYLLGADPLDSEENWTLRTSSDLESALLIVKATGLTAFQLETNSDLSADGWEVLDIPENSQYIAPVGGERTFPMPILEGSEQFFRVRAIKP